MKFPAAEQRGINIDIFLLCAASGGELALSLPKGSPFFHLSRQAVRAAGLKLRKHSMIFKSR